MEYYTKNNRSWQPALPGGLSMIVNLNAFEVFEIAERIERNGAMFYRKAAEIFFDDADIRKILLEIAEMEDEHERTFSKMRRQLTSESRRLILFDTLEEIDDYLKTMADKHVFDTTEDINNKLTGNESIRDVLQMAINAEKDSVVFYVGLKNLVSTQAGRDRIEAIIIEEMKHIAVFSRQLAALESNGRIY
jgi:rubrerythrin